MYADLPGTQRKIMTNATTLNPAYRQKAPYRFVSQNSQVLSAQWGSTYNDIEGRQDLGESD
jgi:hypothetical protein